MAAGYIIANVCSSYPLVFGDKPENPKHIEPERLREI